jgi:hypothetical protein
LKKIKKSEIKIEIAAQKQLTECAKHSSELENFERSKCARRAAQTVVVRKCGRQPSEAPKDIENRISASEAKTPVMCPLGGRVRADGLPGADNLPDADNIDG